VNPARWPRENPLSERLLHVDPRAETLRDCHVADLPDLLRGGDLLVVNDAATLPASLRAHTARGAPLEVRLVGELSDGSFRAVLFGSGDWRTPTERRPPPESIRPDESLSVGRIRAVVERRSPISSRLVDLRFDRTGEALWSELYRIGRPVQYSYTDGPLDLWHVQVAYASRPWAAEMPSAGRPLRWELLLALRNRGVRVVSITHAAGLSSTGDPALDAALPLPERFEVPDATVQAIEQTRRGAGRVVAVGTTPVRALEGAAMQQGGAVTAGAGVTDLVLGPGYRRHVVDGLLTGIHEPEASHYVLLQAFAPSGLLTRATAHSERAGYLSHEFGDSWLILSEDQR
jgi:S-adenosylmethionine:tRNA ribosyltransferase-isomerase